MISFTISAYGFLPRYEIISIVDFLVAYLSLIFACLIMISTTEMHGVDHVLVNATCWDETFCMDHNSTHHLPLPPRQDEGHALVYLA